MNEVIIGVDGGTTAVKAVAFDLTGEVRAVHHESVPVHYGGRGEAEQDMALLWDAVVACLAAVAAQLKPLHASTSACASAGGCGKATRVCSRDSA